MLLCLTIVAYLMKIFITRQLNWSIKRHDLGFFVISVVYDFFTPGKVATNLGKLKTLQITILVSLKTQANLTYFEIQGK